MAISTTVKRDGVYSKKFLDRVLYIEKKSFPKNWLYPWRRSYYHLAFKRRDNINVFLHNDKVIIGYLLMVPYELAWKEMIDTDNKMKLAYNKYYLDTIQILPKYHGLGGSTAMLLAACKEANKRSVSRFAAHLRTKNNFNLLVKKLFFSNIISIRKIKAWKYGGGEPYEYVEWKYVSRKKI